MCVDHEQFKHFFADRGYTERVYHEQGKWSVLYSNNGIKCEIKKSHYTFGWGAKGEYVALIRKKLIENGAVEKQGKRSGRKDEKDFINVQFNGDILETFWDMVELIEGIEEIVKKTRTQAVKPFTKEECEENLFEKIAKRYAYVRDSGDGNLMRDHRYMLDADIVDKIITAGRSANWTPENSYREHVVPCVKIHNEAWEMTKAGAPLVEVAQMIKQYMTIVLITNEEAELLDNELDMQTTMPKDWKFGDDVFARLKVAGIQMK